MGDVTQLVRAAADGDRQAADELLPLVYEELRQLAAQKLSFERKDHTLQATALVHQAYLRLVNVPEDQAFNGRGHFFAAAAEAMRRILVDHARQKKAEKRGGGRRKVEVTEDLTIAPEPSEDLCALDEALTKLESVNPQAAQVVKLRYFGGLSLPETASSLNLSQRTAGRSWSYAKAWLARELRRSLTISENP